MTQSLTRSIISTWSTLWHLAMDIWDAWGIQLLVLASFICQIILVLFGGRRRNCVNVKIRFLIWTSYLLTSTIATIALGKLTVVTIRNPKNPEYNVELQGLLAPLLLMHLANPDSISAYSVVDTLMGKRRVLSLLVQVGLVVWILLRCFDTSSPMSWYLYIPLFIAGVIKPVATIFALTSVHDDTTSVDELNHIGNVVWNERKRHDSDNDSYDIPKDANLNFVLMAYHRFDCLRPHRVNWFYHSIFIEKNWMSVDRLSPEATFSVTEMELGFVYDAMYTQSPTVYTKIGLASRVISTICLVSTLCGFSIIFRSAFLLDSYVAYTYAILIGSTIMEFYQLFTLPFSYWAVVALWEWSQQRMHKCKYNTILRFLVRVCKGQKMWSNVLPQLNLMSYCLKGDFPKPVSCILSEIDGEEKIKKYLRTFHETIDTNLKVAIIKIMRNLDMKILSITPKDFKDGRGLWTLEDFHIPRYVIRSNIDISYMNREFDKCIIIWHIATDILLLSSDLDSSLSLISCHCPSLNPSWEMVSKLLSNYMMYLLMDRPYMLSLTTGDVTIGYTLSTLEALANQNSLPLKQSLQKTILQAIMDHEVEMDRVTKCYKTFITENWYVLRDVKQLVTELKKIDDDVMWKLISNVWIELLCYAAYKSQAYQHMRMLRKGSELITHVWLLLLHKIDKFPYCQSNPNTNV